MGELPHESADELPSTGLLVVELREPLRLDLWDTFLRVTEELHSYLGQAIRAECCLGRAMSGTVIYRLTLAELR